MGLFRRETFRQRLRLAPLRLAARFPYNYGVSGIDRAISAVFGDAARIMIALERQPIEDHARYSLLELIEMRRQMLRYARSVPRGPLRNQHRQVAASLRNLFKNKAWLLAHAR